MGVEEKTKEDVEEEEEGICGRGEKDGSERGGQRSMVAR